jgi:hypothetical protein
MNKLDVYIDKLSDNSNNLDESKLDESKLGDDIN